MQMIAVEFAKEYRTPTPNIKTAFVFLILRCRYNKLSPPKPVEFLEAFMLQVTCAHACAIDMCHRVGAGAAAVTLTVCMML